MRIATAPGLEAKRLMAHFVRCWAFKALASGMLLIRVVQGPGILDSGEKKRA